MKAPARLGLYGLVLVTVFVVAGFTANALIPASFVERWVAEAPERHGGHDDNQNDDHGDHDAGTDSLGLGLEQDGYRLIDIEAPTEVEPEGTLSFAIGGPDGSRVNEFDLDHEEEMHLIVVRSDGQHFRHVHPDRDADGTWSIPWSWDAAGTYRVFADFVPTATGDGLTLSTHVQVEGSYEQLTASGPVTEAHVGEFHVTVEGDLIAGESSALTMVITRDGEPVTTLEPYLGAFGHLVALRDGDLAYLHVHPHGDAPEPGSTSGPEIVFEATAPTPGAYLLFFDFR
ncbi:heavy-metal-associated domain-containing protein, partial [uncultured Agrococcus sp.]|uniref:heavy-metal-associated domain-containing protein n=1 Tax=uncultured Agrococcus sp. TaxID=382258 RepID=UPI0025D639F0